MNFLNNKYTKLYFKLLEVQPHEQYTELHHIIPKSLNGSNDKSNLVRISGRIHFLCHYLLTKMVIKDTPEYFKMIKAFMKMKQTSQNQQRYFNSRLYESKRTAFSKAQSFSQKGNKNSQKGTVWIHNNLLKESKKIQSSDLSYWLSLDWTKGRKINFITKLSKRVINQNIIELEAIELFYKFKHGDYLSVRDFCRTENTKSHVYILRIWKKFIIGLETIQGKNLLFK